MKKLFAKRWFRWILYVFGFFLVLFLFRNPILRGIGNYLVAKDELQATDACFVLGGNSFDRGLQAVELAKIYGGQKFVATGGNYPTQIQALDTVLFEAELTKHLMVKRGVASTDIAVLTGSTSTMEESDEILSYCKQHGLKKIAVLSSSFHLRRVRKVFEKKFKKDGIEVLFFAALDKNFDANNWWKDEEGLITCNNEYIKLLYYFLKY
jgi:uncharacterized SAM-binding protein YcdF (DUF218 family)